MESTAPVMRHRSAPQSGAKDGDGDSATMMGSLSTLQMGSASNYNYNNNNNARSNSFRNKYDGTSPYKFRNHSHHTASTSLFAWENDDQRWKNLLALAAGFLLLVAPWTRHIQVHWKVRTLQTDLEKLQNQQRLLQKEVQGQIGTLKSIKADAATYRARNDELLGHLKRHGDELDDFDSSAYRAAEEKEELHLQRVDELEREIQRAGARRLVRAGHGVLGSAPPVRAAVTLAHHPAAAGAAAGDSAKESSSLSSRQLILEMAPAHTYSHALAYFVDLVQNRRLYDGWTLMRTAGGGSILYTVPMDYETKRIHDFEATMGHFEMSSRADGSVRTAAAAGLDKLAVLEHPQAESDYPIEKYSVLFSDHGPNFYIVLTDKINEMEVNRDEVCFAKVVAGQELLDYIADRNHHSGNMGRTFMIGIESIRMMEAVEENFAANRWLPVSQRNIEYRVVEDEYVVS